MRSIAIFFVGLSLCGQTLHLPPLELAGGEKAWLEIVLDSPSAKEPVALQWDLSIPIDQIAFDPGGPVIGPAAEAAKKFVRCSGRWKKAPETYLYRCLAAGPPQPIRNGTVAKLQIWPLRETKPGSVRIQLDRIEALTPDLKTVPLKPAEGVVKVSLAEP